MKPFAWIAFLGIVGLLSPHALAEVEYEIHTGYTNIDYSSGFGNGPRKTIPILIELIDHNGKPIPNAIVVLKRLGPDGWTEEELKKEKSSITDPKGRITIPYPMPMLAGPNDANGNPTVPIVGAVTVIAEGYPSTTIELRDHFKDGNHSLVPKSTPHVRLTLTARQD